ncbi:molybdopterin-dependent oxidoreductase [Thermomonas paludicola]|uniref:molybdopterin-dependent oxidoreductase n=1 Tax=Thermomonas paludicola TaxID=2884874 RepID=UPI0021139611|nr:molybdopterin-dependent oxidoreductase [Thermomonas paludicola]
MKLHHFLLGALLATGNLGATNPAIPANKTAQPTRAFTPSVDVRISGAVKAPRLFDVATLKKLTARNSGPMDVVCASGATVGKVANFRGARLTDVLDSVGLNLDGHKDGRRMVVVARATDGYAVTFSWNELYNTSIGRDVLVAWEKDGKPLDAREGQLLLISGQDTKTGPRHVRWLSSIEVVRMQ